MYRDELEAARSRIAVLENKLEERESESPYSRELRAQRAVAEARLARLKDGRTRRPLRMIAVLVILSALGLAYYLLANNRIALALAMFSGIFIPFLFILSRSGPSQPEREAEAHVERLSLALAAEATAEETKVRVAEATDGKRDIEPAPSLDDAAQRRMRG